MQLRYVAFGLTGELDPKREILFLRNEEDAIDAPERYGPLVLNRKTRPPQAPSMTRDDEAVLALARRSLDHAQAAMLKESNMAALKLVVNTPLQVKRWRPFSISQHESAVWVEVGGEYEDKASADAANERNKASKKLHEASYFAILRHDGQTYTPLWEYGHLSNEVASDGNVYAFEGCCDVLGDGKAEVLLREIGYEWWTYQLYERRTTGYVLVASAASQGL